MRQSLFWTTKVVTTNNTFANYVETEGSKAGWIMPKRVIC